MYNGPAMTVIATKVCTKNPTGQAHYWDLDSPHGAVVHGVCRHCGEERDFDNSLAYQDDRDGDGDAPAEGKKYHRRQRPGQYNFGQGEKPAPQPERPQASPVSAPVTTTVSGNQSPGAERPGHDELQDSRIRHRVLR